MGDLVLTSKSPRGSRAEHERHDDPVLTSVRGNNLDSVRRHNLSIVLEMVHHSGSVSRALLTRRTGLNRSTIADLVAELIDLRLIREAGPESTRRVGRPSSLVCPNESTVAIAVNPEADAITIGVVGLGGVVHKRIRYATEGPPTAKEAVNVSAAIIHGVQSGVGDPGRIVGVGVAVPGLVHHDNGVVRWAPRLQWREEPIAELLASATGLPVAVGNDASVGAVGESLFGSGRGVRHLIYVNGGASGIGGGVISENMLLRGLDGYAGEFGHTRVAGAGGVDTAGLGGTLEASVTRAALLKALRLRTADAEEFERALLASTSPAVKAEVERQLDVLGIALSSAINVFNPELIILGGFLGPLYDVDPERLQSVVARETLPALWQGVRITRPQLGSNILMVGAAELAFEEVLRNPASMAPATAN
ncbi:MAG: hypothetical protein QOE19_1163 [Actinomycetota bacterium]|nr:hypothetical protein [Actinomycetota bacterium]MDQ1666657.1 hypothetical protein [Actinomycetota bacterium]MDQ1670939.1 hypothetical protein [Actinomycetota bacterium]